MVLYIKFQLTIDTMIFPNNSELQTTVSLTDSHGSTTAIDDGMIIIHNYYYCKDSYYLRVVHFENAIVII